MTTLGHGGKRIRIGRPVLAALAALGLGPGSSRAQELPVPVEIQVSLLTRILAFDRNMALGSRDEVVVGVLFQSRYRPSAAVAEAAVTAISRIAPAELGARLKPVTIDLDHTPDLGTALARAKVNVLYVGPLRAVDPATIAAVTRAGRIRSFTGVVRYVEVGLAVAIDLDQDRPAIVINLNAARAEGADFGAQLLKLARIVDGKEVE